MRHLEAVHVTFGSSGLGRWLGESPKHAIVSLRDPLSCGPLPATSSLDEWARVRFEFWQAVDGVPNDGVPTDLLPDVTLLREAESIVVWLGTGLDAQLCLPWLLWVLSVSDIDRSKLRLIQFPPDFGERGRAVSVSLVALEDLPRAPPAVALSAADFALLERAWQALTSPTPHALMDLVRARDDRLLLQALAYLARRYPEVDNGLGHWDQLLPCNVAEYSPRGAYTIGRTLGGEGWDTDPVGDYWLLWRLRRFADKSLQHPLVELEGDPFQIGGLKVALTQTGRDVIEGRANAVQLNGIDDWVGGVHLDSTRNQVWFARDGVILE